jgi:hypothetical protein
MYYLVASWDLTGAIVMSHCFSKAGFSYVLNEEAEVGNEMEGIDESA